MADPSLVERLRQAGLGTYAERIAALALPAIRLETSPADDAELPVGATKFGGAPDLPPDVEWPEWSFEGRQLPLAFLAQFDLREFAGEPVAAPLPRGGLLSFFYEATEQPWGGESTDVGAWRVYLSPNAGLVRREVPDVLLEESRLGYRSAFQACRVTRQIDLTLPAIDEPHMWTLYHEVPDQDAFRDAYHPFIDPQRRPPGEGNFHQLLGHPVDIQAYTFEEGWRLLLQVDSDEKMGTQWGDAGMLQFALRESDLALRRFDQVAMVLQCY